MPGVSLSWIIVSNSSSINSSSNSSRLRIALYSVALNYTPLITHSFLT